MQGDVPPRIRAAQQRANRPSRLALRLPWLHARDGILDPMDARLFYPAGWRLRWWGSILPRLYVLYALTALALLAVVALLVALLYGFS